MVYGLHPCGSDEPITGDKMKISQTLLGIVALAFVSQRGQADGPVSPDLRARTDHRMLSERAGTGPTGYSPRQIRHAYGFDQLANEGELETIAIVEPFEAPTVREDLEHFSREFDLPQPNLEIIYPEGPAVTDEGWAVETAIDTQWVHATAPRAKIILVLVRSNALVDLLVGVDTAAKSGASVVSMSWGANEVSLEAVLDHHFNVPGVTFVAGSGDSSTVFYPSVSPYVVSVGGTRLVLDELSFLSETAWTSSGGGISLYEPEPDYQSDFPIPIPSGYAPMRGTPDISFNADPSTGYSVYDSFGISGQKGWFVIGGTSVSGPVAAGMFGIVNSLRFFPLSNAHAALYETAKRNSSVHWNPFRDIVEGCNSIVNPQAPLSCAAPGYDYVTGLGAPRVRWLAQELAEWKDLSLRRL